LREGDPEREIDRDVFRAAFSKGNSESPRLKQVLLRSGEYSEFTNEANRSLPDSEEPAASSYEYEAAVTEKATRVYTVLYERRERKKREKGGCHFRLVCCQYN